MDLFFDLTIMAMLMVTIIYAWRLNGKLNTIRGHKAQLKANIEVFHEATEKAVKAVKDLQREGKNICKDIDNQISKARLTSDEIEILIASVNKKLLETKSHVEENFVEQESYEELLQEPYNSNFSISSIRRKFNRPEQPMQSKFNSINEAELAKALREKQYREALVS